MKSTAIKILVPTDGSDNSKRAVEHLTNDLDWFKQVPEIHLLHVTLPIPLPNVKKYISREIIDGYHREESAKALEAVKSFLNQKKVKYIEHSAVGQIAETITAFAKENKCDCIYMGTRGMSAIANAVLGSVANKVLNLTTLPVILVK